jgi:hypothetical protein
LSSTVFCVFVCRKADRPDFLVVRLAPTFDGDFDDESEFDEGAHNPAALSISTLTALELGLIRVLDEFLLGFRPVSESCLGWNLERVVGVMVHRVLQRGIFGNRRTSAGYIVGIGGCTECGLSSEENAA